jgi:hypothetical protein
LKEVKIGLYPRVFFSSGKAYFHQLLKLNNVIFRRVIHDKLPIDITALCGVLEYTCGSLVVSMNYQQFEVRAKSTFHKVVLPRSWLQVLLENIKEDNLINTPLAYVLVQPLSELLRVYSSMSRAGLSSISFVIVVDDIWIISPASNYNMILSRM